jgi:hypothetical protein
MTGLGQRPHGAEAPQRTLLSIPNINSASDGPPTFGRGSLIPASAGIKRDWQTKFDRRSPRYTTILKNCP